VGVSASESELTAMLDTAQVDNDTRTALFARLKSIEGQARGIQRMLEEGRDCQAIVDQLTALRAASHAVTMQALERFAARCLRDERPEAVLAHFVDVVAKLTR
jgi:CsoR family transcriptional regulator, copper-sensing transcriptional repressor